MEVFDASVRCWPALLALEDSQRRLTYTELKGAAERVAAQLANVKIGLRDCVGIRIPSGTADLYIAALGVMRAGAAYVPVDFGDPESGRWCAEKLDVPTGHSAG